MTAHLRNGAMVLAFAAGIGLAAAQTAAPTTSGPTSSGPTSPLAESRLELTAQQRSAIYQTVTKDSGKVRRPPGDVSQMSIGAQLPASVELYELPDTIGAELPATKFYKYTVVQNAVVIVDPTTLKIVDVILQ